MHSLEMLQRMNSASGSAKIRRRAIILNKGGGHAKDAEKGRRPTAARSPALSDYGLIGDMRTAALIGLDGAIDWCCLPRFDSGSVFAAILDQERGGTWSVRPAVEWTSTQRYLPRTNILETTFRTAGGVVVLTDFMPVDEDGRPSSPHPEIHRQVRCTRGRVPMQMTWVRFSPRTQA